jgi:hypothetical protein
MRRNSLILMVGMTRFELAAPRPPGVCATGLRHIPIRMVNNSFQRNRKGEFEGGRYRARTCDLCNVNATL